MQNPATRGAHGRRTADGVADLPFANGKVFPTLDLYLAHLKAQGGMDLPWWREVAPGVYEQVLSLKGAAPERATRAVLEQRFNFAR